jgi:hypothetical protein
MAGGWFSPPLLKCLFIFNKAEPESIPIFPEKVMALNLVRSKLVFLVRTAKPEKMKKLFFFSALLLGLTSCKIDPALPEPEDFHCANLAQHYIYKDYEPIRSAYNLLLQQYPPLPAASEDMYGHRQNTDAFLEALNAECPDIQFVLGCYACMESYPPQSYVLVLLDSLDQPVQRRFNILVPPDSYMSVRSFWP